MTNPELPKLIEAIYKIPAPKEPRNDLVDVFLKGVKGLNQPPYVRPAEELRLNTSIKPTDSPKRLGVLDGDNAGFPNGRRLTDDVIDASLQVVEGELVGSKNDLGDAVDKNDKDFEKSFPYVALPTEGSRGRWPRDDLGQRRPQPARGRAVPGGCLRFRRQHVPDRRVRGRGCGRDRAHRGRADVVAPDAAAGVLSA